MARVASRVAALVLLGSLASCVREKPSDAPRTVATVTATPVGSTTGSGSEPAPKGERREPITEPCDTGELPPADLIADNIAATELSGLGEIVAASASGLDGSRPPPTKGLINLEYEVRVLRQFAGPEHERLTLFQGAEAGAKPRPVGSLLFFSACASKVKQGAAFEPDVAYFFPVDGSCRAEIESRAAAAAASKGSGAPTACQP